MLRILLGEDCKSKVFIRLLREAGHDVTTTMEVGIDGSPDSVVLAKAVELNRVLITKNCKHFQNLHDADPEHVGILMIFQEPNKVISNDDVIRALKNIEESQIELERNLISINSWKY